MQMVGDLADRIHVLDLRPHHCGWRAGGRVEGPRGLESLYRNRGVKSGRTGSAESPVLGTTRTSYDVRLSTGIEGEADMAA